jgi:hypothetical protein
MLTADDILAVYDRLALTLYERLRDRWLRDERRAYRAVRRHHGLPKWADLRLPCYREARRDWYKVQNLLLDGHGVAKNVLLMQAAKMAEALRGLEAAGVLAQLPLTRQDLERCPDVLALLDRVQAALDRLERAGQSPE